MTFGLSPSNGITAREAHDSFLRMMREREEFEVETDMAGEPPLSSWSETLRVVVEYLVPELANKGCSDRESSSGGRHSATRGN